MRCASADGEEDLGGGGGSTDVIGSGEDVCSQGASNGGEGAIGGEGDAAYGHGKMERVRPGGFVVVLSEDKAGILGKKSSIKLT